MLLAGMAHHTPMGTGDHIPILCYIGSHMEEISLCFYLRAVSVPSLLDTGGGHQRDPPIDEG